MTHDPAKHHRRSIRLKGHDYAGGGLYFVTLCAHREFIAWARGNPFGNRATWATCVSPVQIIEEEWRRSGEIRDDVFPGGFVVMPDHFHGLIRIKEGPSELGHIIGAFKAAVSRRIRRGDTHVAPSQNKNIPPSQNKNIPPTQNKNIAPTPNIRIWHRNYYEIIVRSPAAEKRIAEYIRMNPWRCVQDFGGGLRGIGNPALWNREKLGVLCSRNAPRIGHVPAADVYFGGWHSPKEKEILDWLLQHGRPVIACPAWGIQNSAFAPGVRAALEQNRMLILEMLDISGNLAAAEARNRFVIQHADTLFTPHISPGGMLDRLLRGRSKE
ncbi:MAG: hypothetical protein PHF14_09910 [Verrucomicrobiota bacterium]|nr:hypothetical protein [Verrucomicrobiota bacterium]